MLKFNIKNPQFIVLYTVNLTNKIYWALLNSIVKLLKISFSYPHLYVFNL